MAKPQHLYSLPQRPQDDAKAAVTDLPLSTILCDRCCFHGGCSPLALGQELLLHWGGLVAWLARSGSIILARPAIVRDMILHTNRWMLAECNCIDISLPLSNIRLHQVHTLLKSSAVQPLLLKWRCGLWEKVKEFKTQEALQHNNDPLSNEILERRTCYHYHRNILSAHNNQQDSAIDILYLCAACIWSIKNY